MQYVLLLVVFLHNYAIEDIEDIFEDIENNELNKFTFFFTNHILSILGTTS